LVTEIAATLAFSAIQNNDKIGVIFFTDRVEKFIPPKKGRKHILYIIRELLNFEPVSSRTDIGAAVEFMTNAIKRRCTVFVLSDFFNKGDFSSQLTVANRRHDVVALQIYDQRLTELPKIGIIKIRDAETHDEIYIDTSSRRTRQMHHEWWVRNQMFLRDIFTKSNVDNISIRTDEDFVKALMLLFKKRS
jgi:uncharacterized protein (DUF58 family)